MRRFNITCPKKYTKNGEEKTSWNRVGTLVKFDATNGKPEGYLMELNMFPDTKFAVFEDRPKGEDVQTIQQNESVNDGSASPDDIPFN